ncbi:MAG: hypothetical protein KME26_21610 [Oscillatoria princeps RMCB-10]|jgi:hypothetical protein|nr:hypothetical protein [Oscillatoria princeps RMCB-10]
MEDFGIIVACCASDYLFAKGCCASIRHFLGDVPICLLVDGTFSVADAEKAYGVSVINHNSVTHEVLKRRSFGWGKTKMIGFWQSPWKHFLMLDADTIIWGDLLKYANFKDFDLIVDRPRYRYSDDSVSKFFFEIREIEKHFPHFPWQKYRDDYYCTGMFFGTRDIFPLSEYIEILDFTEKYPGVFKYGEMGFLNFMIFRAAEQGRIRVGKEYMQLLVPDFDQEELRKRFPVGETGPVVLDDDATVIHWCGPKPTLSTSRVYSEPMNFCRRKFMREVEGVTGLVAEVSLQVQDAQRFVSVYNKKVRKKLGNLVKAGKK